MGCDYYADEEGRFKIEFVVEPFVKGWRARTIAVVNVEGLEPRQRIYEELEHGEER